MTVYLYDMNGLFINEYDCQLDPLESQLQQKNIYLIPANSTEIPPPEVHENQTVRFVDGQWTIENPPEPPPEQEPQPTIEELQEQITQTQLAMTEVYEMILGG